MSTQGECDVYFRYSCYVMSLLLGRVLLISKMYAAGTVAICVKYKVSINGLSSSGKCEVYRRYSCYIISMMFSSDTVTILSVKVNADINVLRTLGQ